MGLKFEVVIPNIDEKSLLNSKHPSDSCYAIARKKALRAKEQYPQDIIIACDQMACLNGKLFGKAHTQKKAIETLAQLSGKTHILLSALCMIWEKKEFFPYIKKAI